jgi:hypothetical protein
MEENKENQKDNEFNYNCELTKIEEGEDGHIYIAGIATTDSLDHDGEIVDADAVKSAWGDYKGVIRYMHGKDSRNPDAVGVMVDRHVDSSGKTWKTEFTPSGPFIVAKISNAPDTESIRTKIREGVISAFSIGGRAKRIKTFDPTLQKDVNRVITTRISEISLVDLPANKDSYFSVLKAACVGENCPLSNDGIQSIEKTEPTETDPVVDQAVQKFESIINENNDMKETLNKLEEQIEELKCATDPITIVKSEENKNTIEEVVNENTTDNVVKFEINLNELM